MRARETEAQWTTSQARKTLAFWLILLTTSIMFFAQTATNLHAAPHFQTRGVSFESSVVIVFIFAAISAVMTVPWGWVMDRLHVRFVIGMVSLLYFGSMVVIINAHTFVGAVLFGVVFGVAQGGWTVSQRIVVPNYFGRRSVGGIRGQMGLMTAFINPVGPLAAAWIRDPDRQLRAGVHHLRVHVSRRHRDDAHRHAARPARCAGPPHGTQRTPVVGGAGRVVRPRSATTR